eukprot:729552-Rhodomonas_salina.3
MFFLESTSVFHVMSAMPAAHRAGQTAVRQHLRHCVRWTCGAVAPAAEDLAEDSLEGGEAQGVGEPAVPHGGERRDAQPLQHALRSTLHPLRRPHHPSPQVQHFACDVVLVQLRLVGNGVLDVAADGALFENVAPRLERLAHALVLPVHQHPLDLLSRRNALLHVIIPRVEALVHGIVHPDPQHLGKHFLLSAFLLHHHGPRFPRVADGLIRPSDQHLLHLVLVRFAFSHVVVPRVEALIQRLATPDPEHLVEHVLAPTFLLTDGLPRHKGVADGLVSPPEHDLLDYGFGCHGLPHVLHPRVPAGPECLVRPMPHHPPKHSLSPRVIFRFKLPSLERMAGSLMEPPRHYLAHLPPVMLRFERVLCPGDPALPNTSVRPDAQDIGKLALLRLVQPRPPPPRHPRGLQHARRRSKHQLLAYSSQKRLVLRLLRPPAPASPHGVVAPDANHFGEAAALPPEQAHVATPREHALLHH